MGTYEQELVSKGKYLSWLLRHDKESFEKGLIDENGWREVDELIVDYQYSKKLLNDIVETNNKARYEYNADKSKIRARQGHSIPVDVELTKVDIDMSNPFLYHGTTGRFLESIKKNGLLPQTRQYVHLSKDTATAINVGKRHGNDVYVITIDAWQMENNGENIYISNNGVYNVKRVDPKYFTKIEHIIINK